MKDSGRSFDPTDPPRVSGPVVDYSLARKALINLVRRGVVPTTDACDAHPELLRAGKNIGEPGAEPCPICSHDTMPSIGLPLASAMLTRIARSLNGRSGCPGSIATR